MLKVIESIRLCMIYLYKYIGHNCARAFTEIAVHSASSFVGPVNGTSHKPLYKIGRSLQHSFLDLMYMYARTGLRLACLRVKFVDRSRLLSLCEARRQCMTAF